MRVGRASFFGLVAIGAIIVSSVGAPQASADQSDCPSGYICLWDGPTFGGARVQFHDNGWQNLTNFGFNTLTSSYWNNTNRIGTLSEDVTGAGKKLCIDPGEQEN